VTRHINADHLMSFIQSEAEERAAAFKPTDSTAQRAADLAFIEGLESVAQYVIGAVGAPRDPDDSEIAA
jgi:hypothetical protein